MTVCDECFDTDLHLCLECLSRKGLIGTKGILKDIRSSIFIFTLGFLLIIVGSFLLLFSQLQGAEGSVSGGAVLLLGPIPIILGGGPHAHLLVALALIVTIAIVIAWFVMGLKARIN
ncbi:MAG: DUF131 domain-containing protein [Candidatus Bathyarchaeia archaeon]